MRPIGADIYRAAWTGRRCFACQDVLQPLISIQRLDAYQCHNMTARYYYSFVIAKGIRQERLAVSLVHRNCLARAAGSFCILPFFRRWTRRCASYLASCRPDYLPFLNSRPPVPSILASSAPDRSELLSQDMIDGRTYIVRQVWSFKFTTSCLKRSSLGDIQGFRSAGRASVWALQALAVTPVRYMSIRTHDRPGQVRLAFSQQHSSLTSIIAHHDVRLVETRLTSSSFPVRAQRSITSDE